MRRCLAPLAVCALSLAVACGGDDSPAADATPADGPAAVDAPTDASTPALDAARSGRHAASALKKKPRGMKA